MLTFPCSKINIGLNVVARRPDGYHDLQTVFYPIPLTDTLETRPLRCSNAPYALQQTGIKATASAEENIVVKVFRDLQEEFSLPPTDIYLRKKIPTGAGLGGGSSDAAAMITLLNEEHALGLTTDDMERRIAAYGADCAFFINHRPCYATGIGDQLQPLALSLKGLTLLLVKPQEAISTREAYAGITPQPSDVDLREVLQRPVREWRDVVTNDFEGSVFPNHPSLPAIKETLYDMGALYASMSGSGSTMYGIFPHPLGYAKKVFTDCFVFERRFDV